MLLKKDFNNLLK